MNKDLTALEIIRSHDTVKFGLWVQCVGAEAATAQIWAEVREAIEELGPQCLPQIMEDLDDMNAIFGEFYDIETEE